MAQPGKLTARQIGAKELSPGRYHDGGGLFLNVTKAGTRSWVVRLTVRGERKDRGLGSFPALSLAEARELAGVARSLAVAGKDPRGARNPSKGVPRFRDAAQTVFDANKGEWKNAKHRAQWLSSLDRFVFPRLGDMLVSDIETDDVLAVLEPIWLTVPETARRVRQRIVFILDWAHGQKLRAEPLHISAVNRALPRKKRNVRHHPAMEYAAISAFLPQLRERETMARLALEALILTATRSGEVRLAEWKEVDFDKALWTIPAARMKAGKPHVVPLSPQALRVFSRARDLKTFGQRHVFAGAKRGRPLSDMALVKVMRDLGLEAVPHGFRSAFRDWVAEETDHPADLAEAALAHTIKSKVEAAYRRGKLLAKRRVLMAEWAEYCGAQDG